MAFVQEKYCNRCEKTTIHTNTKCNICHKREERERIAIWNSQTVDEKLQELRQRVERLEAGPPMY